MNSGHRIYMDYQASTPSDPRVLAVMAPYLFDHPGNPHASDHVFGWEADAAVKKATKQVAAAIGADDDEVIFTSGATEANNFAVLGLAARRPATRKRILVSSIEHTCVLAAARAAASRYDLTVELLPVDSQGIVRLDTLSDRLSEEVLLVSVVMVNNEIGTVQPIEAIAELCRGVGALLHTDAVQALTAGELDVEQLDVDLLSLSAHKLYGPKGVGALYVRREVQSRIEPLLYGGSQQGGLRAGTLPVPLCVGFGEAAELLTTEEAAVEREKIRELRNRFVQAVGNVMPNARLNGPSLSARHPGNANMCFGDLDARDLLSILQPRLAASTGSACTSGTSEPSHVLRAIGLSESEARASVRFSIGRFSSRDEMEGAIAELRIGLIRCRAISKGGAA